MDLRNNEYKSDFIQWGVREGHQAFVQPSTITLPTEITLNEYGWIPLSTTIDQIIPIASILPNEKRTLYWISEKIVTNSSNPIRMSLEGNFSYDTTIGDWSVDGWKTIAGYTVSDLKSHEWQGLAPIKTREGEALRLRVFPKAGNNEDFYFKFVAIDLPWIE